MKKKISAKKVIIYVVTLAVVFVFLIPILWLVTGSIKDTVHLFSRQPVFWFRPKFESYKAALSPNVVNFQKYLFNTAFYAISSTGLSLLIGIFGAYTLAISRNLFSKSFAFWVLIIYLVPPISLVIPLFLLFNNMGLIGTRVPLVIAYATFNLPFVVWIMSGLFAEIEKSVVEAALVDGCTPLGAFVRVSVPLALPGIVVTSIFCLIFSWNEFLYAFALSTMETQTASAVIGAFRSDTDILWGRILAGSVLMIAPLFALALLLQKYVIRGLTFGAVKG